MVRACGCECAGPPVMGGSRVLSVTPRCVSRSVGQAIEPQVTARAERGDLIISLSLPC